MEKINEIATESYMCLSPSPAYSLHLVLFCVVLGLLSVLRRPVYVICTSPTAGSVSGRIPCYLCRFRLTPCSLLTVQVISADLRSSKHWELTEEGKEIAEQGSHEARVFGSIPDEGLAQSELMVNHKPPHDSSQYSRSLTYRR